MVVNPGFFSYPQWGSLVNYYNILSDSLSTTHSGKVYAMHANVPANKTLKIVLKAATKSRVEEVDGKNQGWIISQFDNSAKSQTFISNTTQPDLGIVIAESGKITIEYYEDNSVNPTKVKILN